jgi:hypothetical protein
LLVFIGKTPKIMKKFSKYKKEDVLKAVIESKSFNNF